MKLNILNVSYCFKDAPDHSLNMTNAKLGLNSLFNGTEKKIKKIH